MKYFGTDGIRGVIGRTINSTLIKKVANGIILYYQKHNHKKILLVGNDTRISADYILAHLQCYLLSHGIEIENIGTCSSPCLAYLTQKYKYPLGLMISASHNPAEFNGLKFFNNKGEKVGDEFEEEFETLMEKRVPPATHFVKIKNVEKLKKDYMHHLKGNIKNKSSFIFDCANGGTSEICKAVFPKQEKLFCHPNGTNINKNCGCTHIEFLQNQCIKKQKIGFAFDGDGDRVSVVSETGEVVSGDKILYILSNFFQHKGDTLVGTIYTNTGLEKLLNKRGIKLERANVGDKNVYRKITETKSCLGGEESGHFIIKKFANTGDGILCSIVIANLLSLCKKSLSELLNGYYEYYNARTNLSIKKKFKLDNNTLKEIKKMERAGAKIIVRPSGTEPVLRLFVEHKNKEIAQEFLKNLENLIKNA